MDLFKGMSQPETIDFPLNNPRRFRTSDANPNPAAFSTNTTMRPGCHTCIFPNQLEVLMRTSWDTIKSIHYINIYIKEVLIGKKTENQGNYGNIWEHISISGAFNGIRSSN